MIWSYFLLIISTAVIASFFVIRRIQLKRKISSTGIKVSGIVTGQRTIGGRYPTAVITFRFTTLEGKVVNGESDSSLRHTLKKGEQVSVIYDVDDSSNHTLQNEIGTDKNYFALALIWSIAILFLLKKLYQQQ